MKELTKLTAITYKQKYLDNECEQEQDTTTHYGLIAQELLNAYPEIVNEDPFGYLSVNYTEMIPVLINAIKELKSEMDILKKGQVNFEKSAAETSAAKLEQNTPNPFDKNTEIKFYIPADIKDAMIVVFDITGKQMLKFDIQDRGYSSITISANQLQSGMYLYTLIVDGLEISYNKLILLGQ